MKQNNRIAHTMLFLGMILILLVSFYVIRTRHPKVFKVYEWYYSLPNDSLYIVELFPANSWEHVFQFSRTSSMFEHHTDWNKYDALCTRSQLLTYYDCLPCLREKLESEKVVSAPFFRCTRIIWEKNSGAFNLVDYTLNYSADNNWNNTEETSRDTFGSSFLSIKKIEHDNEVAFSGNPSYPHYVSVEQMLSQLKDSQEMLVVFPDYSGMIAISQPNSTSFRIIEPDSVRVDYWNKKEDSRFKHFLDIYMPVR